MKQFYSLYICHFFKGYSSFIFFVVFLFSAKINSQNTTLNILYNDVIQNKPILLKKCCLDKKFITQKMDSISNALILKGYFNTEYYTLKVNDTTYHVNFNLKKQYKNIIITQLNSELIKLINKLNYQTTRQNLIIKTSELPTFLNNLTVLYEEKGNPFAKISLKNIILKDTTIKALLNVQKLDERQIDEIVIKGYESFPKSFLKNNLKLTKKNNYNTASILNISKQLKNIPFVSEIKKPQTLFTRDATHLYLYLKKINTNRFDGLIGFSSNKDSEKISLNGYLNLHLSNLFNYGSTIDINWESTGNKNQKFKLFANAPYIFNTAITPEGKFELYKQDSTFITINNLLNIKYAINNTNNISLSYQHEVSTDLNNLNSTLLKDYKSDFYGLQYQYKLFSDYDLFPIKLKTNLNTYLGNRKTTTKNTQQVKLNLEVIYNYKMNYKNYLSFKLNSGYLIANNYLDNELFRIGGQNTVRGFLEESILATNYQTFTVEYNYLVKNDAYLYSITDFGLFKKNQLNTILGLGLGYAFKTKIGLLNLNYVLGKTNDKSFNFNNGVINMKYVTVF